ncbi:TniB family NTP-binding protein [Sphingomonas sp. CGMCC 1.13654]|uniref:TniB family NTP-binding protein n=1 Tax=Sphingomonas chungangi TaxID=2683589 RepID=A0A838L866_9SPHN|nr:TniB family NTP-binding protein [Sphingomonas chungangi]MBA2935663.1 TniB family NTP-binding protein [Sphingomonas chungangi]
MTRTSLKQNQPIGRSKTVTSPRRGPRGVQERRDVRDAGGPIGDGAPLVADRVRDLPAVASKAIHEVLPPQPSEDEVTPLSLEMRDAFKRFRVTELGSRSVKVARAMAALMQIRLPYPRQIEFMSELEELRLMGREMQGQAQLGMSLFERTGCGKSTAAAQYRAMVLAEAASDTMPVLHARLGTSGTARDLYVSIMSGLGDGFPMAGTEHTLRRRAMTAMEAAGVGLLILDEAHHSGRKTGFGAEVTAELKIMLDTGTVPIVLLGTEEAIPIIGADRELSGRFFSPCRLAPLDVNDDDDFDLWTGFLKALDARMVADGIVSAPAQLAVEEIALALGETCDGIIGQLMRVMLMSLREVVRDGRERITVADLATAVDQWSIELGFAKSNPFNDL